MNYYLFRTDLNAGFQTNDGKLPSQFVALAPEDFLDLERLATKLGQLKYKLFVQIEPLKESANG